MAEKKENKEEERKPKPKQDKTSVDEKKIEVDEADSDTEEEIEGIVAETVEEKKDIVKKKIGVEAEELEGAPYDLSMWVPRTKLGLMVKNEELTSMIEVIHSGLPVKEFEIVDKLLPNLEEDIINVGRVQRVTDSGRRMRFRVVTAVGNQDGFIGIGHAKGKEAGPTIRKAIARAKMNIRNVKRGCGSWQCGCGNPHTVPFKISGISGSVKVDLLPAPRGVGLVGGEIAKKVLKLAGIKDAWVHTSGHTRTSLNFAYAVYDALVNTNYVKLKQSDIDNLKIVSDATKIPVEDGQE